MGNLPKTLSISQTVKSANMIKIVLDSNIWNKLAEDDLAKSRVQSLCDTGELQVLVPDTLLQQLKASPFGGVPDWFPAELISDSVFVLDHSRLDFARLGDGTMFTAHRGASQQISDAVIVDVADTDADVFVSEDQRARNRYAKLREAKRALDYVRFRQDILGLQASS